MAGLSDTVPSELSYWLAIDENLDPHKFRCIEYSTLSERFYTTEYGTVSIRRQGALPTVHIKPMGRPAISIVYDDVEPPTVQEMLSLLVFWTANPLFLAVPAPTETEERENARDTLLGGRPK